MAKLISNEQTEQYTRISYRVSNRSEAIKLCKKHGVVLGKRNLVRKPHGGVQDYMGCYSTESSRHSVQMLFIWLWK